MNKEIFPHPLSVHNYILRIRGGEPMYMESGLLDLLNIAPLNEDTYKPADLYYDDTLSAYWTTETALMGPIRVSRNSVTYTPRDEGKSLASGCDSDDLTNQVTMVDFIFSGDTEVAISSSDVFCPETEALLNKKRAQSFFPASAFNAKMRMFIQSVYGSKRDYTMDHVLGNLGGLRIDGTQLNPYFDGYILYTGFDYQYFVLNVRSTIRVTKLELSTQGEKLRQWLIDNPQTDTEQRRYEAYLLSTATFGDFVTVGSESTTGQTFGYTWHANWNGTEAHKVTHKLKSGTTNVWEFRHYKLEIEWHGTVNALGWDESSDWTFTLTTEEGPTEATFRVNQDLVWSPDWAAGGMELFVSQDSAGDTPTHVDADVPVHVVSNYDDDSIDLVRFKREDLGSGGNSFGGSGGWDEQSVNVLSIDCAEYGCEVSSTSDGALEVGFYIQSVSGSDNTDWQAVNKAGEGVQVASNEAGFTGDPIEVSCPGTASGLCTSAPASDGANHAHYPAFGGGCTLKGAFDFEGMLVVPFYDCDAVYLGADWSFSGSIGTRHTLPGANVWAGYYLYDDGVQVPGNPYRTGWDIGSSGPISGNGQNCTSGSRFLFHRAANAQDLWVSVSDSPDKVFSEIVVRMYANGSFNTVHENRVTDASDVAEALYIPRCLNVWNTPLLDPPSWETGSPDHGGFEFDPVVFPIAENALPVIARGNLTGNYRATQNPGGDTFIDDGEYAYDTLSQFISYVGHD